MAPKLSVFRGLLAKAEAVYGDATAVSNTADGVLTCAEMVPSHDYLHSGERRAAPGMAGNMRRVAPGGRGVSFDIQHDMKGAAAAYSASISPSGHRLILASGFDAAVDVTGGSEKVTYTPAPKGVVPTSLSCELYGRETKFPVNGVLLDMKIDSPDIGVPLWTFGAKGRGGTYADAPIPVITYPTLTTEPPKATTIVFTMGSFVANAVVRSWSLAINRSIGVRANQNIAGGHAGFSPGRRNITMEVVVENTALVGSPYHTSAGLDPYLFFDNATEVAFSLLIGATQYNKYALTPGKVQMAGAVKEEDDEGAALWRLTLQCNPTTVNGNDDLTILFS